MVAEVWLYPDGSRILELSTKTVPNEAVGLASEVRTYLVEKGVPTNAAQETKTLTALQYYSKTLLADLAAEEAAAKKASARSLLRRPRPPSVARKAGVDSQAERCQGDG